MAACGVDGHALLVGSPGSNLKGVEFDVHAMAEMLCARGFAVDVRIGPTATREGILAGYDELIRRVRPDEPAVFYYTGHGFYACPETEPGRSWQGIYPADKDATTTDDFRGITAWELSIKQAQLTKRTRNVTTILDCCYASQMSRDAAVHDAVARALPHPIRNGFAAHLEALKAEYPDAFGTIPATGNPDAVRLVACGQNEAAYEYRGSDGQYRGVFTEALLEVLREVEDAPVSWAAIGASITSRVNRRFSIQHPGIEGPSRRRLFALQEDDGSGAVPIVVAPTGFRVFAGHVMGVTEGDVYGVMPSGSVTYEPGRAAVEVKVVRPSGTMSIAELRAWKNGQSELPRGAIAFPIEKTADRHAVQVDVPDTVRDAVERAIEATPILRLVRPGETSALPTLRWSDRKLTLEDRIGPLFPNGWFPDDLASTVKNLANLGAAQALRNLEGEHGVTADELEIEWGTVDDGRMQPMPPRGGSLALLDKLYVKVVSKTKRPLYVHLFNIGLRGKITLLTSYAHTGVRLTSQQPELVLGQTGEGTLAGCDLSWPAGMPRDTPRIDEIVVIATAMPAGLTDLETVEQPIGTRGAGSLLEGLLSQLQGGGSRAVRGAQEFDGFFVQRLLYLLHPRDAVMADLPFEIDDNPLRQAAMQAPAAWGGMQDATVPERSSETITVRIDEVTVDNIAVLPGNMRIDMLVATPAQRGVSYQAWTARCSESTAGKPTIRDAVVFQGAMCEFVELHLWVSTDRGPDLAQLLEHHGEAIAGRDGDAPPSAFRVISAAGASSVLARAAYGALRAAAGRTIGVYRTCLAARDVGGKHGHPAVRSLRTPNVSFSLTITGGESGRA